MDGVERKSEMNGKTVVVKGDAAYDGLVKRWIHEGRPRRFTLSNGNVYSVKTVSKDAPEFTLVDPSDLYGSSSVSAG